MTAFHRFLPVVVVAFFSFVPGSAEAEFQRNCSTCGTTGDGSPSITEDFEMIDGEKVATRTFRWRRYDTGDCEWQSRVFTIKSNGDWKFEIKCHCHRPFYGSCRYTTKFRLRETRNGPNKWMVGEVSEFTAGTTDYLSTDIGNANYIKVHWDSLRHANSYRGCRTRFQRRRGCLQKLLSGIRNRRGHCTF